MSFVAAGIDEPNQGMSSSIPFIIEVSLRPRAFFVADVDLRSFGRKLTYVEHGLFGHLQADSQTTNLWARFVVCFIVFVCLFVCIDATL